MIKTPGRQWKPLQGVEIEAVTGRRHGGKVFLEISQNSQENTRFWVSFLIKLQVSTPVFIKYLRWLLLLRPNFQFLIMLIVTYAIFQLFLFHPQWWNLFFPPNLLNARHLWKPTLLTVWYFILFFGYFIFYLLSIYGLWSIADVEQDSGLTFSLLRF